MLEVLRSGQLSLGPRVPEFEQRFAARLGAPHACAVSSGTAGLHLALRAVGVEDGDEVVTSPFSFVASANAVALRARAAGVRRHRPGHAQPRPGGRRGRRHRAHEGAAAGAHLRLPGRHAGVRARSGLPIVEDACEALGARPRRRHAGRRARPPGGVRLLRQQAADDGRGRDGHARRRGAEGADRLRAQPGPRARHGLARPRPPRLQLPPVATSPARSASRSSSGSTRCSPRGARVAARYREALAGDRGPRAARARTPAATRAAGSCSSSSCRAGVDRDDDDPRAARARRPEQAVPAGDPPDELLPRALRPPRGRVPGLRGRRRALARAAVLPRR